MSQSCAISSRRPKCANLAQTGTNVYETVGNIEINTTLAAFENHWLNYLESAGDGTGSTVSNFEIQRLQNRLSSIGEISKNKMENVRSLFAAADEYELDYHLDNLKDSQSELKGIGKK